MGHFEAVKILIEVARAEYTTQSESGTPLILAVESGNIELVSYIRSLPLCPSLNDSDLAGVSPFYVACYNHRLEMINYLLDDPSVDVKRQRGPNNSTIFHGLVDRDFRKICQTIIGHIKQVYPEEEQESILKYLYLE